MAFTFTVEIYPGSDLEAILERAKRKAEFSNQDVTIRGNTSYGTVSGVVTGSYRVSEDKITFTITKKPAFVSESMIRIAVESLF